MQSAAVLREIWTARICMFPLYIYALRAMALKATSKDQFTLRVLIRDLQIRNRKQISLYDNCIKKKPNKTHLSVPAIVRPAAIFFSENK